jgi:hypothetical protein
MASPGIDPSRVPDDDIMLSTYEAKIIPQVNGSPLPSSSPGTAPGTAPGTVVVDAVEPSTPLEPSLPREAIDELYDFVFNGNDVDIPAPSKATLETDKNNNKNPDKGDLIGKYFDAKLSPETLDKGCYVMCDDQEKNDVKNFCVNNIDVAFKQNQKNFVKEHKIEGVLGTDTMKTTEGYQILYSYNDDESNPEKLMGFETFESSYMTL